MLRDRGRLGPKNAKATLELRVAAKIEEKGKENAGRNGNRNGGPASISTIAQHMGVKSGSELVIAAATALKRGGSDSFTKRQLREQMREAKAFYKGSYRNNFDNYVARLTKAGRLNHLGGENYALPAENEAPSA